MTEKETLLLEVADIQKEILKERKIVTNDKLKLRLSNLEDRVAKAKILICKKYS